MASKPWLDYNFIVGLMMALWSARNEAPSLRTWDEFPDIIDRIYREGVTNRVDQDKLLENLTNIVENRL